MSEKSQHILVELEKICIFGVEKNIMGIALIFKNVIFQFIRFSEHFEHGKYDF